MNQVVKLFELFPPFFITLKAKIPNFYHLLRHPSLSACVLFVVSRQVNLYNGMSDFNLERDLEIKALFSAIFTTYIERPK